MILKSSAQKIPLFVMAFIAFSPFTVVRADQSAAVCEKYAENYAQQNSARNQVFGGAASGAALGGVIGSIFGGAGAGAVVGTGLGVIVGSNSRSAAYKKIFEDAFIDCMSGGTQ